MEALVLTPNTWKSEVGGLDFEARLSYIVNLSLS